MSAPPSVHNRFRIALERVEALRSAYAAAMDRMIMRGEAKATSLTAPVDAAREHALVMHAAFARGEPLTQEDDIAAAYVALARRMERVITAVP